jgi:hypothetical protein
MWTIILIVSNVNDASTTVQKTLWNFHIKFVGKLTKFYFLKGDPASPVKDLAFLQNPILLYFNVTNSPKISYINKHPILLSKMNPNRHV